MADHGTRTRYVTGCRCEPCTVANREYARNRDRHLRRVAYGIEAPVQRFVDATETRQHLHVLRSADVGLRTISAVTGISRTALQQIASGETRRVLPDTANRILGIGPKDSRSTVDATRTWAYIDDLVYLGYSKAAIARVLGYSSPAIQIKRDRVFPHTANRVKQVWFEVVRTHAPWHGTIDGYRFYRCKCIQCRRWCADRAERNREQKAAA